MNKLLSWAFGNTAAATASQGANAEIGKISFNKESTQEALPPTDQSSVPRDPDVDTQVAEFFNDFPEPYRQKAIHRFSSREGLYRWNIFRTYGMQRERDYALKGTFLEDSREADEQERWKEEQDRTDDRHELMRLFHERHIPEWEKATLKLIPLQPGDSMPLKLFQSSCLVASSAFSIAFGISDKRNSSVPRFKANLGLALGLYLFLSCNVLAVARLMDLGIFDRSVDDRFWHEKFEAVLKDMFRPIHKVLGETTPPP